MSTDDTKPLRIAIDCQLTPGGDSGGIEQFVMSLVRSLGELEGKEEYVIVGHPRNPDWLAGSLAPNQWVVCQPPKPPAPSLSPKRFLGPMRGPLGQAWRRVKRALQGPPGPVEEPQPKVPESNGFYESLGADVVHFPFQAYKRSSLPTIYNPHDLLHCHYPQFLPPGEVAWRSLVYRAGCTDSRAIAAESEWVKADIVRQYDVDPGKIVVIRRGSPTDLYGEVHAHDLAETMTRFGLPATFALYPAQTWVHKNHLRLIEAVHHLRLRHGVSLNLVCTGRCNDLYPLIERRIRELKLERQVFFPGYLAAHDLRTLYRLAQFVVFPSLFEGGGFPVVEAFREGVPVTCSRVTSLPEYGGDAVLYFDPQSVVSIAEALFQMTADSRFRETLRTRGTARAAKYNWKDTARAYRALYRKVAGRVLAEDEKHLLPLPVA